MGAYYTLYSEDSAGHITLIEDLRKYNTKDTMIDIFL